LKFQEPSVGTAGAREFDVLVNGKIVLSRFDIFAAAGGKLKGVDRVFDTASRDDGIVIEFRPLKAVRWSRRSRSSRLIGIEGAVPRARRYRWLICGLLFAATAINYVDRQIIGVLKPTLQHEFAWTESDFADVIFWFQVAYALGYMGFGSWSIESERASAMRQACCCGPRRMSPMPASPRSAVSSRCDSRWAG